MTTTSMALMMTKSRLANRRGEWLLDALALLAYAVSSALLLTTLGGVWMFWERNEAIEPLSALNLGVDIGYVNGMSDIHVTYSIVALALLAIPLLSLGAAAAQLGANGRSRRLATLRLVGVSGRQVIVMSAFEAILMATLGFIIGAMIYAVTLLLWSNVSFHAVPFRAGEMLLPWLFSRFTRATTRQPMQRRKRRLRSVESSSLYSWRSLSPVRG